VLVRDRAVEGDAVDLVGVRSLPTSATTISTSNGLLLSVKIVPRICAYQLASPGR
jgi:hypothetical protein